MTPFPLPVQTNITWVGPGQTVHTVMMVCCCGAFKAATSTYNQTMKRIWAVTSTSVIQPSRTGRKALKSLHLPPLFIKITYIHVGFVYVCVCARASVCVFIIRRCQTCDQQSETRTSLNEDKLAMKLSTLSKMADRQTSSWVIRSQHTGQYECTKTFRGS